jgi:ankyrin repeat protein
LLLNHHADIALKSDDGYNTQDVAMENRNRLYMRIAMRHMLEQSIANEQTRNAVKSFLEGTAKSLPALSKESSVLLLNLSILDGNASLFAVLMKRKVNPNNANRSGHYPLSIAASWSEPAMLAHLLKAKAKVDQQNDNRYRTSALMESTRDGNVTIAQMLLAHGAKINLVDIHQDNALNWAVFFGRAPIVKLLLDNKADASQLGQQTNDNAMDIAIRQGVPEVTELLREAGAKASKSAK